MKIFDCFPFFNEIIQLKLRIELLQDHVDHFVVMEADQTHSGQPKPLYLRDSGLQEILNHPKLILRSTSLAEVSSDWGREQYQREALLPVLAELGAEQGDLVLISDVDEIPSPSAIKKAATLLGGGKQRSIAALEQRLFYFRLNYEVVFSPSLPWIGTCAAIYGNFSTLNGLRNTARGIKGGKFIGYDAGAQVTRVLQSGWHFSYLGDDDRLKAKLSAFAHQERSVQSARYETVSDLIAQRKSLHRESAGLEVWRVTRKEDIGLPPDILEKPVFSQFILEGGDDDIEVFARIREAIRGRDMRFPFNVAKRAHGFIQSLKRLLGG